MQKVSDIDRFLDSPVDYFDWSLTKMCTVSLEHLEELQLAGLKRRFEQFRGNLPMMDKLADLQNIHAIEKLNDVLPLLFDHSTFKSYPSLFLEKGQFQKLTAWLNKLTTHDLSGVDATGCHTVDDWMNMISRDTPLKICHTSGTSGTLSFLPWTKTDWKRMIRQWLVVYFQRFGDESSASHQKIPLNIDCVYPYFRSGHMGHTVLNDAIVEMIAGGEERFHAAYPGSLSADLLLLAAKRRAAVANGTADQLQVSPEVAARRDQFEAQQRAMPQQVTDFFSVMSKQLLGKRVFIQATSSLLYPIAEKGLKQGLRNVFASNSVISAGGGGKGASLPDDWKETIKEFIGVDHVFNNYGMSELMGTFPDCEYGHHHAWPSIIPFMLDSKTAKPLPRKGTVTGRIGFFDLMPDTRWGGFITNDEVTMVWDTPCSCGRTTPYLKGKIQRYGDKQDADDDEKISCAATPAAYAEALDFLNDGSTV